MDTDEVPLGIFGMCYFQLKHILVSHEWSQEILRIRENFSIPENSPWGVVHRVHVRFISKFISTFSKFYT